MGGRHPWAVIGSLGRAVSFATDALAAARPRDARGRVAAGLSAPMLPGRRRQHEHSMAVIQDAPLRLEPGARRRAASSAGSRSDHPAASSPADLASSTGRWRCQKPRADLRAADATGRRDAATLFSARPILTISSSTDAEITDLFGTERRHVEREGGATAVVLRRRRSARRAEGEGAAGPAPARAHPAQRRSARARRGIAHLDDLDGRRVPLAGHAGARQHQSLPVDDAQLPRPAARRRPAHLRRARRTASTCWTCRRRTR